MKMRKTVSDKNREQHPLRNEEERNTSTLTPKSRTKQYLTLLGLEMSNVRRKIVKKLEMKNAEIAEVNAACKASKSEKEHRVVTDVVSVKPCRSISVYMH